MKKHFIFDMDGTLSDTAKATYAAFKAVEEKYKLPDITEADVIRAMGWAGMDFYRCIYPALSDELISVMRVELEEVEQAQIDDLGPDVLFPGVMDMLTALRQVGCRLYVASTGGKDHVHGTLNAAGIADFFDSISCGEPAKVAMVQRIVGDSDPEEWAMIGDMFKDAEAARGSNIMALGAGFGYLDEEDHKLFDAVLRRPMDILEYC